MVIDTMSWRTVREDWIEAEVSNGRCILRNRPNGWNVYLDPRHGWEIVEESLRTLQEAKAYAYWMHRRKGLTNVECH
jgi:hypothetical protein